MPRGYLAERGYRNVQIFCSAGDCRNNLGPWEVKSIKPPHSRRDFEFFTAKDAAMAEEADVGLMLWDGESSGTLVNAARLIAAGKPVVVYITPDKEFRTLNALTDTLPTTHTRSPQCSNTIASLPAGPTSTVSKPVNDQDCSIN